MTPKEFRERVQTKHPTMKFYVLRMLKGGEKIYAFLPEAADEFYNKNGNSHPQASIRRPQASYYVYQTGRIIKDRDNLFGAIETYPASINPPNGTPCAEIELPNFDAVKLRVAFEAYLAEQPLDPMIVIDSLTNGCAPSKKCDCGAEKANTLHARWCSTNQEIA